jgi:hypothetical protein
MWQHFFHFPPDVALILTKLATYDGFLPQGAKTSSYIANLVFWDKEPRLVSDLKRRGLRYTRYVDDITISSERPVDPETLDFLTERLYGMLFSTGVQPNRAKRSIQTRSGPVTVHKLNINAGRPTIDKRERSRIRASVKECEDMAAIDRGSAAYKELYDRTVGRVNNMRRLHPRKAEEYRERLKAIPPVEHRQV